MAFPHTVGSRTVAADLEVLDTGCWLATGYWLLATVTIHSRRASRTRNRTRRHLVGDVM